MIVKEKLKGIMNLKLEKAGEIRDLQRQVRFTLIPPQRIDGKLVERECAYIADSQYHDAHTGELTIGDTKGVRTKDYIIKRKLMLSVYGIKIREI